MHRYSSKKDLSDIPRQEHIPNTRLGEVEDGRGAGALHDLEVQRVQHRPDQLALGARHECPEQVSRLHDVEPLGPRLGRVRAQPELEQRLERRSLLVALMVRDQPNQSACLLSVPNSVLLGGVT